MNTIDLQPAAASAESADRKIRFRTITVPKAIADLLSDISRDTGIKISRLASDAILAHVQRKHRRHLPPSATPDSS